MKRETRLNLVFLCLLLAAVTPGAIMLVRKKLQPGARPLGAPDPVRRSIPYMDPAPVPATMQRTIPPLTVNWIQLLAREKFNIDPVSGPLISRDRRFEVAGLRRDGQGHRILLLLWQHQNVEGLEVVAGNKGAASRPARIIRREVLALPHNVSLELRDQGYIRPPDSVVLLEAQFDQPLTDAVVVTIRQSTSSATWQDFVNLFTNPDSSGR